MWNDFIGIIEEGLLNMLYGFDLFTKVSALLF